MGKSLGSINGFCRLRFIHLNPAAGVKRMGGGRGVSENSFVTTENSAPPHQLGERKLPQIIQRVNLKTATFEKYWKSSS